MRQASFPAFLALSPLAFILAGCATVDPPELPKMAVPASFHHGADWTTATPADALDRGDWWHAFGDPVLDGLMVKVDTTTPTLAAALARYDQALANAREAGGQQYPTLNAQGSASRERLSAGRPIGPGNPVTANQFIVGGSLSYELDLWGRVRNSVRAAQEDAEAEAANLRSARLSLQAMVADLYIRLRGIEAEQQLLDQTVSAYERAHQLIVTRHDGGIASGVDVSRSQTQLSSVAARAEALKADHAQVEHQLAVLIGEMPSTFSVPPQERLSALPAFPSGLPAELLQRRPDIAAAQRRLAAANARIGVARAAFFPDITLGLTGGYQATGAPIISAPTSFWGLGPLSAVLNLFDGGRRKARLALSKAQYEELAANYRGTVLGAFQETEDALARIDALYRQNIRQQEAATAAKRTEDLALDRYRDGAADYLEVTTAQTASLAAQQDNIRVSVDQRRAAIALVRAIGGGTDTPLQAALP
ncbi:efflux transporter outer membrane subunit [Sphingobium sp. CCH11-B1]|jgi:multidrug efflux system outer membrane protein|uniref:efflux transporter outer membrane subunit n=1 Tax=Sphingobium sp. CCH11-B1 TaxID=1768781 RepID=UPI00082AF264|nr:efflux transporter outer membrane subunit [Sphingobium sp. CCH11-B1]MEA3389825.1 efflux transporter outer membrane subunit [Pseudomonadota bacterium]